MATSNRNARYSVELMKQEIISGLSKKARAIGYRKVEPQLQEAYNFIKMIEKAPYQHCATVGYLVHEIREERNRLTARVEQINSNLPGHQMSLFEASTELTLEQERALIEEKRKLEEEIRWLHKCLGIALNPNYFK